MTIDYDDSIFPIVISKWMAPLTDEDLEAYFLKSVASHEQARSGPRKLIMISYSEKLTSMNAAHRKRISEHTRALLTFREDVQLHSFVVINNAIMRGVFTAIMWMSSDMQDSVVVSSLDVAAAKAAELCKKLELEVPEKLLTMAQA